MLSNLIVPEDDEDELELEFDDESLAFLDQINEEVKEYGRENTAQKLLKQSAS